MSEAAFREAIVSHASEYGLDLSDRAIGRFARHYALLVAWNRKINLTRITEPDEAARRHFLESAFLTTLVDAPERLVDVGSGAGFPGVPLACVWPETPVVLVEPLLKRAIFLKEVAHALELPRVEVRNRPFDPRDVDDRTLLVARALDGFDVLLPGLVTSSAKDVALFSEPDLLGRAGVLASNRAATLVALPGAERRIVGLFRR